MNITIYTAGLFGKTGLSTWVKNFVYQMRDRYEITLLSGTFGEDILEEMEMLAHCKVYDKNEQYECDIYLHNFQDNAIKPNINARQTFILLHCDYAKMSHSNVFDGHMKYIAVSEEAADHMRRAYKIDCVAIEPFLVSHSPQKVLKLVSATRLTKEKGYLRMVKLCELLKANNIRFQWLVFSEYDKKIADMPEFICMGQQPNDVVMDYMADADYTVQLSDHEGWGYSVHESLSVGTPVLVTGISVFDSVIEDGYNGYKLPLDMNDINIERIVNDIPAKFAYQSKIESLIDKWGKVFE